jgi:hypothetical protein
VKSKTALEGERVKAPWAEEKATTTALSGKEARVTLNDEARPFSDTSNVPGPNTTTAGGALPMVGWLVGALVGAILGVAVGRRVGEWLGAGEGLVEGAAEGGNEGDAEGAGIGIALGVAEGAPEG